MLRARARAWKRSSSSLVRERDWPSINDDDAVLRGEGDKMSMTGRLVRRRCESEGDRTCVMRRMMDA